MDTSNWMSTQAASGIVGDPAMGPGDWRDQLQRQRIVNKIMDTLKRHLPFTGYEQLQQLKKIAERVEEEIYTAATSQPEYTRKICFMMLTMETRLQLHVRSNSAASYNSVNPAESLATSGGWRDEVYQKIKIMKDLYLNGDDWQEEVYQKIKAMKNLYLQDLNVMHQKLIFKLQQYDSLPQQPKNEQLEKMKVFKYMLERFMQFLQIPKHEILVNYKDRLPAYERQIISIINSNKRKPAPPQQQAKVLPNGVDWQEEVYQKIKAAKDMYLLDLNDTHQKILSILQQLQQGSLPQQPKGEQIEELEAFMNMLERFMKYLQTPKHEILGRKQIEELDAFKNMMERFKKF